MRKFDQEPFFLAFIIIFLINLSAGLRIVKKRKPQEPLITTNTLTTTNILHHKKLSGGQQGVITYTITILLNTT